MSKTTESAGDFLKYYSRRGHQQRGDEETDAYSDNEGEEDTRNLRRERRERTKLVNSAKSSLVQRAVQTPGLTSAQVAVSSIVDTKGRVGVGLTGVSKVNEDTMRAARNINRAYESEVTMENLNYTNHETQMNVQGMGAKLTLNALRLLDLFTDAKKWKRDMWISLILLLMGSFLVYYTIRSLSSYL